MLFERIDMQEFGRWQRELRRDFHRYPESGWTEFRTTARIIEELEKLGLTVRYGPAIHVKEKMLGLPKPEILEACFQRAKEESSRGELIDTMRGGYTGCIALIEGALPGPTIGIRVDIDCNDVQETTDKTHFPNVEGFASVHQNCMHACGHDGHAAIGLGVAKLLTSYRDQLRGKVLLVFQPGEEGLRGAASLTAAGHFTSCDYFFSGHIGLHDLAVGTVVAGSHGILSSSKFDVSFAGVSSHAGASPELGRNAIAAAASAVLNMLAIPRHHAGPSFINVGTFHGGSGRNVIPAHAELTVETRGGTSEINRYMEDAALRVCKAAAEMYGCTMSTCFMGAADSLECDKPLIARARKILERVDGVDTVLDDADFGGSEDVATIMSNVQAHGGQATQMIFCVPLIAPHHNSHFDFDERVMGIASRCFATLALEIADEA